MPILIRSISANDSPIWGYYTVRGLTGHPARNSKAFFQIV